MLLESFLIGLATPLTAACVIPLYPGFLAYISRTTDDKTSILQAGLLVGTGVLTFITLIGLLFTAILEVSLTTVIGIVSPLAYAILLLIGISLILGVDFSQVIPHVNTPQRGGRTGAFLYGFFFGAIIIPCNPGLIAFFFANLFAQATQSAILNMANILLFGVGIATPLVALAAASNTWSKQIINVITTYKRHIDIAVGTILIAFATYYLFVDFAIHEWILS